MIDPRCSPRQMLRIAELFEMNGDRTSATRLLEDVRHGDDAACRQIAKQRLAGSRRPGR